MHAAYSSLVSLRSSVCNEEKRQTIKRIFGIKTRARNWILNLVFRPCKRPPMEIYSFTRHDGWAYTTVGTPITGTYPVLNNFGGAQKNSNVFTQFYLESNFRRVARCMVVQRTKAVTKNKRELSKKRLQR